MDNTIETEPKTKHTKVGEIPKDWSLDKLRKNAIVYFSNVDKHIKQDEISVSLCNYQDVYYHDYITSSIPFSKGSVKPSEFHKFQLKKGDVIITKDSEDRKDIAVPAYVIEEIPNLVCGYHLALIRPNEAHLDGIFLSLLFQSHSINHYFQKLANGVTRFGLTTDSIKNALIPVPPLNEQQKIAEILSTWDLAISTTQCLINELKIRNIGLSQQLLTGKKRLKEFKEEWKDIPLGKCAKNVNIRNKETHGTENLYAVTKKSGIIPMREQVKGENFNNCKIVRQNWFAYNPMRINIGSIALWEKSEEIMVSGDYVVFECDENKLLPQYLKHLRKTVIWENHMLIAGNGSVRIRIYFKDLAHFKFPLPPVIEQKSILQVLDGANKELKLYQQQLDFLKEQKKGLMQKLLTGEIRVRL
ncbi:restriction endonuclease subunit S [Algoriphagus persicinus]|uniref:restriction endonuclease subunit S n=1 Tax=Algoriphagus persicinus TaxID=3108754 RepID=UPI002B3CA142|nr:restriction endonuclease subunit S [Algoriphagus sp. E1-3-M2]MEB2787241.1 restriction endonuclease subunit S [Algoriphagus sp. E1-3-M2]